jgi:DNA-binding beta-propeller fold protein YncE
LRGSRTWLGSVGVILIAAAVASLLITAEDRDAAGDLTARGCIADVGNPAGCGATAQGLDGASGVAVSPDGATLYAVSNLDDAIVRFDRAANGALSNSRCIADVGDPAGCGATAQGLDGAEDLAVSPEGPSVYAVSAIDDAIVRFDPELPPPPGASQSEQAGDNSPPETTITRKPEEEEENKE